LTKVLITTIPFGDKKHFPLVLLGNKNNEYLKTYLTKKLLHEEYVNIIEDIDVIIAGT